MYSTLIIVFREILEIAIIVGVILAATKELKERYLLVLAGIGFGIIGSVIVAIFAGKISDSFAGSGQEIFNATVLIAAVFIIGWTVIWMKTHGREIVQHAKKVSAGVVAGDLPNYSVSVIIMLATLREGSEIVLFVHGILAAGNETITNIITGGFIGLGLGTFVGMLIYFGLLRISPKHLFTVTSWLLAFLAAGMAAGAAGYLNAAGKLPAIIETVWDSSAFLPEDSLVGKILHALLGYTDRPSGIQVLFYVTTIGIIGALMKYTDVKAAKKKA